MSRPTSTRRVRVSAFAALALLLISQRASAQNILVNPGFESNPPTAFGNNPAHPIAPWVLGAGQKSNVVRVDGPQGGNYGTAGPQSDASAPGAGVSQHYLDIVDGSGDFYQSFTPQCSGQVRFGGSFSTRQNRAGTASVRIVQGVGTGGAVVGTTQAINRPAGTSMTDPWTTVSFMVPVTAGTTYSFVVSMDNNMNFDNGFVNYLVNCNEILTENPNPTPVPVQPLNPCCPPWHEMALRQSLTHLPGANIGSPYTVRFQAGATLSAQMQAYINYVTTMDPTATAITIAFTLQDAGTGATPATTTTQVGAAYNVVWNAGGTAPTVPPNLFPAGAMQVNRWYTVRTEITLNGGATFFPDECVNVQTSMRIQVQGRAAGRPRLEFYSPPARRR